MDGIPFESFVIYADYHGRYAPRFELRHEFLLYHKLYFDPASHNFIDMKRKDTAAKYEDSTHLLVKESYLRDFLAAGKWALVRFHSHIRSAKGVLPKRIDLERREDDRIFNIAISQDEFSKDRIVSSLVGKDIVMPYNEPKHADYLFLSGAQEKHEVFLIGRDNDGRDIFKSCNGKVLSRGEFLTPVYFDQVVLRKYYESPEMFDVDQGYVFCLDMWSIPYGVNTEGKVHVWLGDLGRVPHDEQLHWKQYNQLPSGGISPDFLTTQLLAKPVESSDPISGLKKAYDDLNTAFESVNSFPLFKALSDDDSYVLKSLHLPLTDENIEFDQQVLFLSKFVVDSINKEAIVKALRTPAKTDGSINQLETFLVSNLGLKIEQASELVEPLRFLYKVRSRSAAHRKGTAWEKLVARYGLTMQKPREIFEGLVKALTSAFLELEQLLRRQKNV